jgi:hypothetical protein
MIATDAPNVVPEEPEEEVEEEQTESKKSMIDFDEISFENIVIFRKKEENRKCQSKRR